jgi:hypothetical protein
MGASSNWMKQQLILPTLEITVLFSNNHRRTSEAERVMVNLGDIFFAEDDDLVSVNVGFQDI